MESTRPKIHVVHVVANNSRVPYFNWLAERVHNYPDVKFTIVSLFPIEPLMKEDMRLRGCDFYWIKYDKRFRRTWMVYAFFKLFFLVRKLKPDVVNSIILDDALLSLMVGRLLRVKKRVIVKEVTGYNWYFNRSWVWTDLLNNRNATDIVAISGESEKFLLEKEKVPANKVRFVHNGIPIEEYTAQSEEVRQMLIARYNLKDKIVIGTVARYVEWKGHKYIIEAAKTLVKKYPNIRFLFAGHGLKRETERLKTLVNENSLEEHIIFTGFIEPGHMPSFYGIMDICLHASFMEPFGLVFAEAMANGVPIVTTKTGAAADVLEHKFTCYFTNYNDPQGIVDGVIWMLENPEARMAMKEIIKKIANEKFSIDLTMEKYIQIYRGQN